MTEATEDAKLTRVFSRTPSSWDPQDDLLLRHLKEQQKLGWKEIASHFAHRTPNACQFRWRRLRSGLLKNSSTAPVEASPSVNFTTATVASPSTITKVTTKSGSASSTPSHDSISLKENSTSPSTSPDPTTASPYQKFPTLPQQVKSSAASLAKSSIQPQNSLNHKKWNFNNATNSTSPYGSGGKLSKRRYSMKVAPNEAIISSNSSSSDDDDMEKIRPSSVTSASTVGDWTFEEDELLLTREKRQLSFIELSILLPRRTESEINSRIDELEQRSKLTNTLDTKKSPFKTSCSMSSSRHSHPHPMHVTNHIIQPPKKTGFTRSLSSSSQISTASLVTPSRNRSNSFINQDFTRSRSYSITSPYITSVPFSISERYNARKSSVSSSISGIPLKRKPRSESMKQSIFSAYSSDDEDIIQHNTSNIRVEPFESSLPPLGSLFNDYYTK